ncbi:hypothetical protein TNCV_2074131 [Trichonephila clavipes]|nr:hypothetical protein TNCV_2074131 [Trichonephila clavipes]
MEWNGNVFIDESCFCLQHHNSRIRVWRHHENGEIKSLQSEDLKTPDGNEDVSKHENTITSDISDSVTGSMKSCNSLYLTSPKDLTEIDDSVINVTVIHSGESKSETDLSLESKLKINKSLSGSSINDAKSEQLGKPFPLQSVEMIKNETVYNIEENVSVPAEPFQDSCQKSDKKKTWEITDFLLDTPDIRIDMDKVRRANLSKEDESRLATRFFALSLFERLHEAHLAGEYDPETGIVCRKKDSSFDANNAFNTLDQEVIIGKETSDPFDSSPDGIEQQIESSEVKNISIEAPVKSNSAMEPDCTSVKKEKLRGYDIPDKAVQNDIKNVVQDLILQVDKSSNDSEKTGFVSHELESNDLNLEKEDKMDTKPETKCSSQLLSLEVAEETSFILEDKTVPEAVSNVLNVTDIDPIKCINDESHHLISKEAPSTHSNQDSIINEECVLLIKDERSDHSISDTILSPDVHSLSDKTYVETDKTSSTINKTDYNAITAIDESRVSDFAIKTENNEKTEKSGKRCELSTEQNKESTLVTSSNDQTQIILRRKVLSYFNKIFLKCSFCIYFYCFETTLVCKN